MRACFAALSLAMWVLLPVSTWADDARDWFNKAVQYDLSGEGEEAARSAYAWYRRAAEAGLPEAEFNVAVMLDSGRGVQANVAEAATWYARAAVHGNARAAYNLGQLYEAGEGVPKNANLARAWFTSSDLPAARARLTPQPTHKSRPAPLAAPALAVPGADERVESGAGGIEFVWISPLQPESVKFLLELRMLDAAGSHEVFSGFSEKSGLLAALPNIKGNYAWRVFTISRETNRYAVSGWTRFSVADSENAAK